MGVALGSTAPAEAASAYARTDRPNTFRVGPQAITPGGDAEGLRLAPRRGYRGKQLRWFRRGGKKDELREAGYVDANGQMHFVVPAAFPSSQFRGPHWGWDGASRMPADGEHEHLVLVAGAGIYDQFENYILTGSNFHDMGNEVTTDGKMRLTTIALPQRVPVKHVLLFSGEIPMEGCTHIWVALYDWLHAPTLTLLGQTADQPGDTWPAFTEKLFTFPEPILPPDSANIGVGLLIVADQHPSIMGYQMHNEFTEAIWGEGIQAFSTWGTATGLTDTAPANDVRDLDVGNWASVPYLRVAYR